jgi:hypothetical protein
MPRGLKHLSAGVSLVMLAFGFSLLGILSFIYHASGNLATASGFENECCYIGSGASIFAGAIFFAAACAYWRR